MGKIVRIRIGIIDRTQTLIQKKTALKKNNG